MFASAPYLLTMLAAQSPTFLHLNVQPALDVTYSDGVQLEVRLDDGQDPVGGARIDFFLSQDDGGLSCSPGSLPATGADGRAGPLLLRFVDGACGIDAFDAADPDGLDYVIEARFAGDDLFAASGDSVTLHLHRETVTLQLVPEHSAQLGESLTLLVTLVDANGDVEAGQGGTTGRAPKPIAGAEVFFYLDLNDDGDFADPDEALGHAITGASGVAVVDFDSTPIAGLPKAGLHRDALRVEFSGDRRYKFAAALGDLRLEPAAVDAKKTLLEAMPESVPADGFSRLSLRAILVDRFGNPLGADDAVHSVVFSSDLGRLIDSAQRDPASGHYSQELEAPSGAGTAKVRVAVDDEAGASTRVEFTDAGCGCVTRTEESGLRFAPLILAALWRRRTKK